MDIKWRIATTEADREAVYRLRSAGYGKRYRHIPQGRFVDAIDSITLQDGTPRARSILAEKDGKPVGTGRSTLAYSHKIPDFTTEIDFLFNVSPESIIHSLTEDRQIFSNKQLTIGELSRFTVLERQHSDEVFCNILAGFVSLADFYEIDVYICAMNRWLPQRVLPLGIDFKKLDEFDLQRDDPDALWYMTRYYDYFFPRLNDVLADVERKMFSDRRWISYEDLRAIIDGCYPEDVISLYWITPEEIFTAVGDYVAQSAAQYKSRSSDMGVQHLNKLKPTVFSGLKTQYEVVNPFSISERDAQHYFQDPYTRQIVILPDHEKFYDTLVSRNYPLISSDEQQKLRYAKIGIAGQGTVGGNLTLALTRYGFEHLRTSDPDHFDISNLNRQPANIFSTGHSKVDWIAYQAGCINPFMDIDIFEPIHEENLEKFVDGCDVVISALDDPRLIIQLNDVARNKNTPVLLGTDLGTKVLLDVFDYRKTNKLLNGRVELADIDLPELLLVLKIVGLENVSAEMLEALQKRMYGDIDYFAQTVVAANICSALLIKGISSILLDYPIDEMSSIDVMEAILPASYQKQREEKRSQLAKLIERELLE